MDTYEVDVKERLFEERDGLVKVELEKRVLVLLHDGQREAEQRFYPLRKDRV